MNEDIPANMKLSPVQIIMLNIPNTGKKTIMNENMRVMMPAVSIHPHPLTLKEDISMDSEMKSILLNMRINPTM